MRTVDFRSDTITKPTKEMREAMFSAEVGDDVYGEDPTINKLEEMSADLIGKEAALFVPSGTMGNQLAVLCHTQRGNEIVLEERSHIYNYEVGGIAFLSGVQARIVKGNNGIMKSEDVEKAIIADGDIHHPQTGLICMENTHNMAGGIVVPKEPMKEIYNLAKKHNIPVHLDGARIFNASTALGCDVKELTQYCDSIMFCLSKGLCAPVGSILSGSKEFINKARRYRKLLGGGMRQAGILAAAGIVALTSMVERLSEDHKNAGLLAEGLKDIEGIKIDMNTIQSNILMVDIATPKYDSINLVARLRKEGILTSDINSSRIRFVTHNYISNDDIRYTVDVVRRILS
ncbi:low-specificity L-threonine aldolase [Proteiniborus sp. MB09-C3]|uniref:low-specificity L-threonine aldolase n=1 Tax=Proteiniborus sp. MB09-C3 TaxID=3050072 RepID=UPI0025528BC5|nr:low-specificity L-threonine aldolase [Proteiniborus sp. MB09-C3]WIV11865.1 low-specificity L-threonine aldolase [Proteiniborus sp. MB09-C3]